MRTSVRLTNFSQPLSPLGLADGDRYKRAGLGISTREPSHTLQDLIAVLETPRAYELLEALQTASQAPALAPPNRALFLPTRATASQEEMLPLLADELDGDLGILGQVVPATALQLALEV